MTFLDLFAGIGGFRLGMEMAGHKCVGFCEADKYAVASYTSMHLITDEQRAYLATLDKKKRMQEILKDEYRNGEWYSDDIRSVDAGDLPKADIWCFGAPCQDFSICGRREGLDGDRSSLVREVFRILRHLPEEDRPRWLVYENVKGMLSSNRGWDFFEILCEMDRWGYDVQWQLLNSKLHGVPQNRERVYTVGHLRRFGERKVFPLSASSGSSDELQGCISNTLTTRYSGLSNGVYPINEGGGTSKLTDSIRLPMIAGLKDTTKPKPTKLSTTLLARDYKGPSNQSGTVIAYVDNQKNREYIQ